MRQRSYGARFGPKAVERPAGSRRVRAEDLQGYFATEVDVLGLEHDSARSLADHGPESIGRSRELMGIVGSHSERDALAHGTGRGCGSAPRIGLQRRAALLQKTSEFSARSSRLVRPEPSHQKADTRADASLSRLRRRSQRQEPREVECGERGARVALVGVVLRELRDHVVELARRVALGRDGGHLDLACGRIVEVLLRVDGQKSTPRAQLPEDDAERIDVDSAVAHLLARHFGRDVSGLREYDPGDGVAAAVVASSRAEIDELDLARVAHHYVLRRQIAMDDAEGGTVRPGAFVHVGQRLRNLDRDGDRVRPAHANSRLEGPLTHVAQRMTLDILDDGVGLPALVAGRFENLSNAWMLQLRLDPGFVQKAREKRAVVDMIAPNRLNDARTFGPLEPRSGSEVDVAHSAARGELEHHASADHSRQRQGCGRTETAHRFAHARQPKKVDAAWPTFGQSLREGRQRMTAEPSPETRLVWRATWLEGFSFSCVTERPTGTRSGGGRDIRTSLSTRGGASRPGSWPRGFVMSRSPGSCRATCRVRAKRRRS